MDTDQNCDSYINIPSSQTYRTQLSVEYVLYEACRTFIIHYIDKQVANVRYH
jgi:hypothetical protein